MWAWLGQIASQLATPIFNALVSASGYIAAFFAGASHEKSKEQARVIDAAQTRADVENRNAGLSDDAVAERLRNEKQ